MGEVAKLAELWRAGFIQEDEYLERRAALLGEAISATPSSPGFPQLQKGVNVVDVHANTNPHSRPASVWSFIRHKWHRRPYTVRFGIQWGLRACT